MARIRTIKPEFWTSEQVMECSTSARLLFIGLWNFCDDAGRMVLSCKRIKAQIFPSDEINGDAVRRMIDELSTTGLINIYLVDGKEYLQVTGWHHQKIDRPRTSELPAPSDHHSSNDRRTFDAGREGNVEEGKKEEEQQQLGASELEVAQKPLPQTSPDRRRDLDSLEASLRQAAGLKHDTSAGLMNLGPMLGLLDAGADLNEDILPVLRAKAKANRKGRSWAFYVDAVHDAVNARRATSSKSLTPAVAKETSPAVWRQWVEGYRQKRSWLPALGPDPASPACRAPPDILEAAGFGRANLSEAAA